MLDVVHEVLHHQRRLESIWQHRKVRLHQRLQLCVFQQDVQQVTGSAPHIPSPISGCWLVVTRLEEVYVEGILQLRPQLSLHTPQERETR